MNKKALIILSVFVLCLLVISGSYAYWSFTSNENKNIVFNTASGLEDYIVYDEGESKFSSEFMVGSNYLDGVHTTVSIYKTGDASNTVLFATINMRINEIGDSLKNSPALKWVVTRGNASSNGDVISKGNFIGKDNLDTFVLVTGIEVTEVLTEYTIWLWLDENYVTAEMSGEKIDVSIWTQVDQIYDDRFEITNLSSFDDKLYASVVNTSLDITHYAITNSEVEPSNWIEIPSDEVGNVYSLTEKAVTNGVNYVWFKDSEGNIVSRSINVELKYDVTYDYLTNGGELLESADGSSLTDNVFSVNSGSNADLTLVSYRYGFTFVGWNIDKDATVGLDSLVVDLSDVTLYAIFVPNTYTISYDYNGGVQGDNAPSSATYDSDVLISNPTKTVMIRTDINDTQATIGSDVSAEQSFIGWTGSVSDGLESNAKTGVTSDLLVKWDGSSTTNTYFRNLRDNVGTVTLTANWSTVSVSLPTISKSGYSCYFNTMSDGSGESYDSGATYTVSSASPSIVTMYAICIDNVPPTGEINLSSSGETLIAEVTASDVSGIKEYGYLVQTDSTCPTTGYTTSVNSTYNFAMETSGTYFVCVKLTDNYDNTAIISTSVVFDHPIVYLFNEGEDNTTITGGWSGDSWDSIGTNGPYGEYLYASGYSGTISYDARGSFYSNSKIDLSNYESIHFLVAQSSGDWDKLVGIGESVGVWTGFTKYATISGESSTAREYTIDISDLTGTYFVNSIAIGGSENNSILVSKIWLTKSYNAYPVVINGSQVGTYSGVFEIVEEDTENWKIRFISSGNLVLTSAMNVDIFVVGGGGGGGTASDECKAGSYCQSGGAGGGGYTNTYSNVTLDAGTYEIVVGTGGGGGTDGGTSYLGSASTYYAKGGSGSVYDQGGDGGSGGGSGTCCGANTSVNFYTIPGGSGGIYGTSGSGCVSDCAGYSSNSGGTGQGTTTCEFGEGTLSGCNDGVTAYSRGGTGATSIDNSGNGGNVGGAGSSGIVIIRNKR